MRDHPAHRRRRRVRRSANPMEDLYLPEAEAAIRYALFRAEHRNDHWCNVRTMDPALTVSIRIRRADRRARTDEVIEAALSHATRQPMETEIYQVRRDLVRAGLVTAAEPVRDRDRGAVRFSLRRAAPALAPGTA